MTSALWLALAATVAALLTAVQHFASIALTHGQLGLLWRYVMGTASIGVVYGVWLFAQPGAVLPGWAFVAWLAIAAGAGVGTLAAHGVDHWAGMQREIRLLNGRHRHEGR